MSNFLQPHGLQHARLLTSLCPIVCSNLCPLSWWCYLTILPSTIPFSFCLHFFPASGPFPMSWLFTLGGEKYWSFSLSNSPSNAYSGQISFKIDWFGFLVVQRTLKSLLQHHYSKASVLWCSAFFMVQLSHLHMTTGKTIALTMSDFCQQNDVSDF